MVRDGIRGWVAMGLAVALAWPLACSAAEDNPASLYDVAFEAPKAIAKGDTATVSVTISPKSPAEVHKEAPITLALEAPAGVALAKKKVGRPELRMDGDKASFEVPFTASEAGEAVIDATLRFYICTDRICASQERKASLAFSVE